MPVLPTKESVENVKQWRKYDNIKITYIYETNSGR